MSFSENSDSSLPAKLIKKRGRDVFSKEECDVILKIIYDHPNHLCLSQTNTSQPAKQEKNKTWNEIRSMFMRSGQASKEWTVAQLKVWYKNKRSRAKTDKAEHKRSQKQTGGGKGPIDLPADTELMAAILGDDIKSLDNPDDCDAEYHDKNDVVDPDVYAIEDTSSASKTEGVFVHRRLKKVKPDPLDTESFREREHTLFMKKLSLECEVLEKKKLVLDLQARKLTQQLETMTQAFHLETLTQTFDN